MSRKYFGTDGIRGRANGLITPELALKVGQAAGLVFQRGDHRHRVVIGKDTRLSGYMIEYAMVAGFTSVGMDVLLLGPMPTPAVAMLTKSMRADLGVMISASHNLFEDNGIKLFGPQGFKLSDDVEKQIEQLLDEPIDRRLAQSASLGRARRIDGVHDRYIEFAKRTLPRELSLDGLRVVIDCAHGAAYKVVPEALWELGADVVAIGVEPDGFNINKECGSTSPEASFRGSWVPWALTPATRLAISATVWPASAASVTSSFAPGPAGRARGGPMPGQPRRRTGRPDVRPASGRVAADDAPGRLEAVDGVRPSSVAAAEKVISGASEE